MLFTDTDSLVCEIETEDVYEEFHGDKNLFDFGDYLRGSIFFDPDNRKAIDEMKDEFKAETISEFSGLNIYSLVDVNGEEMKKEKDKRKMLLKHET